MGLKAAEKMNAMSFNQKLTQRTTLCQMSSGCALGRNDTLHNDTQHNNIQHNDTEHKALLCDTCSCNDLYILK